MIANPQNKDIYIWNFDQRRFTTSMLALWSFITYSLTMVYPEVASQIPY